MESRTVLILPLINKATVYPNQVSRREYFLFQIKLEDKHLVLERYTSLLWFLPDEFAYLP